MTLLNLINAGVYHKTHYRQYIYLKPSLNKEDHWLKIEGYNFVKSDHPSGLRKEVFVYTIKSLFLLSEVIISAT